MLSTLDDPFTRFLEPEKFKNLRSLHSEENPCRGERIESCTCGFCAIFSEQPDSSSEWPSCLRSVQSFRRCQSGIEKQKTFSTSSCTPLPKVQSRLWKSISDQLS